MTIQTRIVRPTMDALTTILADIGGLARGERDYLDGPRAVVLPPLDAIARLTECLDLLPRALFDTSGPTEWELDFAAHEIREAALIFAAPSRYVRIAEQIEALAYRVWERRAEGTETFCELVEKRGAGRKPETAPEGLAQGRASDMPAEWRELAEHLRRSPDYGDYRPTEEIRSHV